MWQKYGLITPKHELIDLIFITALTPPLDDKQSELQKGLNEPLYLMLIWYIFAM